MVTSKDKFLYINNFNGLRLLAACQVMLGHAINQFHIESLFFLEHFIEIFPGVPIFFIISGFLIGLSIQKDPNLKRYFQKRFLRIYPGLATAFFLSVFVVLIYNVDFKFYEMLIWAFTQLTVLQNYDPAFLKAFGVGKLNPPLWTIAVEIQFYILAPMLIFLFRNYLKYVFLFFLIFVFFKEFNNYLHDLGGVYGKIFNQTFLPHFYLFIIGAYLSYNTELIRKYFFNKFHFWISVFFISNFILSYAGFEIRSNWQNFISSILLGLAAISFAYSYTNYTAKLKMKDDLSYGMYIYHYILINIFYHYGFVDSIFYLFLYISLCFILAFLSWRFVEKPMTKLNFVKEIK